MGVKDGLGTLTEAHPRGKPLSEQLLVVAVEMKLESGRPVDKVLFVYYKLDTAEKSNLASKMVGKVGKSGGLA